MNAKTLVPNVLQYAIAAFLCWLLISGQVSDDTFLWMFLIYGLVNFAIRRQGAKSAENPEE